MATLPDYPNVSSFPDRHGTTRWRFRKGGKTISLQGEPGSEEFEESYAAAIEGRKLPPKSKTGTNGDSKAVSNVVRLPAILPRTLGAAWEIVKDSAEFKQGAAITRKNKTDLAERFLLSPVVEGAEVVWRDVEAAHVKRRHVKQILSERADTPHAASHVLRLLRKLFEAALDEEWIEVDPTYKVKWNPDYKGWRAWTTEERAAFEARWPTGTTPRLVYSLALYVGQRRTDIAGIEWSNLDGEDGLNHRQHKTGKELWLPVVPELRAELDAVKGERTGTIVKTVYGKPFSEKALGTRMRMWTKAAGMGKGATLHGLRKTLGKLLAEAGATTRQLMDILGHDDIAHAELYSREAEQKLMAKSGMERLSNNRRLKVINGGLK